MTTKRRNKTKIWFQWWTTKNEEVGLYHRAQHPVISFPTRYVSTTMRRNIVPFEIFYSAESDA